MSTDISGSHTFPVARGSAWEILLDPAAIQAAIPGCDEFAEVAPEQYKVRLTVNVIAFSSSVTGDVTITERVHPESYRVLVSGSGSLGTLHVDVRLRLTEETVSSATLHYDTKVDLEGQLALIAAPVIGPAAKLILSQFMEAMEKQIAERAATV